MRHGGEPDNHCSEQHLFAPGQLNTLFNRPTCRATAGLNNRIKSELAKAMPSRLVRQAEFRPKMSRASREEVRPPKGRSLGRLPDAATTAARTPDRPGLMPMKRIDFPCERIASLKNFPPTARASGRSQTRNVKLMMRLMFMPHQRGGAVSEGTPRALRLPQVLGAGRSARVQNSSSAG